MMQTSVFLALAGLVTLSSAAPTNLRKRDTSSMLSGLAFAKDQQAHLKLFSPFSTISWGYNWDPKCSQDGTTTYSSPDFEFVPNLHDNTDMFTKGWDNDITQAIANNAKYVLSFNEPDQSGGGGTKQYFPTVDVAVEAHKQWIEPYSKNLQVGAPSITSSNDPDGDGKPKGVAYLKEFLSKCADCKIDFVVGHWTPNDNDPVSLLIEYVNKVHEAGGGRPVWLTEWQAPKVCPQGTAAWAREAREKLAASGIVAREAYFSVETNLVQGSSLTDVGKIYAGSA